MVKLQDYDFPNHLHYDIVELSLVSGDPSHSLMGDVLVFTPKRIGRDFENGRSFATVEGGKWVGSARAAFDGMVVAHNESLIQKPELLMQDAYGAGWMLLVRPSGTDWHARLVTGPAIAPMFEAWFARGSHKSRAE